MIHFFNSQKIIPLQSFKSKPSAFKEMPAGVVKLADTPDLGSGASRHVGSSPITRTFQGEIYNFSLFLCPVGRIILPGA